MAFVKDENGFNHWTPDPYAAPHEDYHFTMVDVKAGCVSFLTPPAKGQVVLASYSYGQPAVVNALIHVALGPERLLLDHLAGRRAHAIAETIAIHTQHALMRVLHHLTTTYAKRQLLGLTQEDRDHARDVALSLDSAWGSVLGRDATRSLLYPGDEAPADGLRKRGASRRGR